MRSKSRGFYSTFTTSNNARLENKGNFSTRASQREARRPYRRDLLFWYLRARQMFKKYKALEAKDHAAAA
jgi:hypothetical protein